MLSTGSAYQHSSESGGGWLQSAVRRLDAVAMVIAGGSERVEGRAGEKGGLVVVRGEVVKTTGGSFWVSGGG